MGFALKIETIVTAIEILASEKRISQVEILEEIQAINVVTIIMMQVTERETKSKEVSLEIEIRIDKMNEKLSLEQKLTLKFFIYTL